MSSKQTSKLSGFAFDGSLVDTKIAEWLLSNKVKCPTSRGLLVPSSTRIG